MTFVIGRLGTDGDATGKYAIPIGTYRARDGSTGAQLHLDVDEPHAMLVVGKRGYGKSYTLGVVAEGLAPVPGVAPVVVDPMGVFSTLADPTDGGPVPAEVVAEPTVTASALDPRSWCRLLNISPESGGGSLVWQAGRAESTLEAMRDRVQRADAPAVDKRTAVNHLALAASWDVFDPTGLDAEALSGSEITVVDVSGLDSAPMNAVVRGIAETLYRARIAGTVSRLPWLLVDEAQTFFDGIAKQALDTLLARGRAPGVSTVLATQRPANLPEVAVSQSDVLVAHRLTATADLSALEAAQPTYLNTSIESQLPTDVGEVLVIDDATETVHAAKIRERTTPHAGDSPSASDVGVVGHQMPVTDCDQIGQ